MYVCMYVYIYIFKDPLRHQIQFKTKERVWDYLVSVSKTDRLVGDSEDQSEPSLTFATNVIHTKLRPENLQEDEVEIKPGASQVWSQ